MSEDRIGPPVKGLRVSSTIDTGEILNALTFQLNREELFGFVEAIDDAVADIDFTKALRDHFDKIVFDKIVKSESTND